MNADRFLKMVENLEGWEEGFRIITTGRNKYNCLGEFAFRLDEPNSFVFLLGEANKVEAVVDLLAVEGVAVVPTRRAIRRHDPDEVL